MIPASRQTLIANIVQQFCAALIILFLPNILEKSDYAQVVYVAVLLSFAAFADAGISLAYGRIVPGLLAQENHEEVRVWNNTTLAFGLLASAVYSLIIALIYYTHYGNALHALLLFPVPFVVFWFSFHVNRVSSSGDFTQYRRAISWRSLGSLAVFPLAFMYGLTGWFIAQLFAAFLALTSFSTRLCQPLEKLHWTLLRKHLREGLMLSCISVLWLQLLNFARLYASMHYNAEDIATYGIVTAAYQSLSTLVISLFLPVSVGLLSRYGHGEESALAFAHDITRRSLPWAMGGTLTAIVFSKPLLQMCFTSYHFDSSLLVATLLAIVFHAFFIVWGNLLVARKHFKRYLSLIIAGLLVGSACAWMVDRTYPAHGAAWGQLLGIMAYTFLLFIAVSDFKNAKKFWRQKASYLFSVYVFSAAIVCIWALGWWQ